MEGTVGTVANFEKIGIPAVGITYVDMLGQMPDEALVKQIPEIRYIDVPRPSPTRSAQQIAEDMVPRLIDELTRPLTEKEQFDGLYVPEKPPRIAFTGTYDQVQAFFEGDLTKFEDIEPHAMWTDGMPIVPPTEEKVAAMLAGTNHSPDEEFPVMSSEGDGRERPVGLIYTVEVVAVNGVMAGCKPEQMPVLLAIAATNPGRFITTTATADVFVVSGPIAEELGMAANRNAFMYGNPANMVMSRFTTLFRMNIVQFEPDVAMQHPQGNLVNRGGAVVAENLYGDYEWPWTSLSEEMGFEPDENTVTKFHTKGLWDFGITMYGALSSDAYVNPCQLPWDNEYEGQRRGRPPCTEANPRREEPEGDVLHWAINLMKASGMPKYFIMFINPQDAQRLAVTENMTTKEDVRQWVWDHATMTYEEWMNNEAWWAMPFHSFTNRRMWAAQGIEDLNTVNYDTVIHLPTYGKEEFFVVALGSGTPLPTLARGTDVNTVSIDEWR